MGSPFDYPRPRPAVRGPVPARPPPARVGAGPPRRARGADQRGRRPHPGPVHQLAGHARRRRGPGRPPPLPAPVPVRPAQAGADRGVHAPSEPTCLFATLGFWQGVDVPGRTLSLVTIDRIPFPRPDEPVLAGPAGAGRGRGLLRRRPAPGRARCWPRGRAGSSARPSDRGVVAVLDSRLATARYRGALLARVPPMKRTVDRGRGRGLPARPSPRRPTRA